MLVPVFYYFYTFKVENMQEFRNNKGIDIVKKGDYY